ncbi:MAG TPA: hypothetical protein VFW83_08740 [Bryobacteraceae bacterium]|nr:hypothetical protein [Bryobacteraceae bacterium]
MSRSIFLAFLFAAFTAWAADYTGPKPPKADMIYLVHADNLIPTETGVASKKGDTYTINGAASPARTPLAEPIFILRSEKISPESIELYRMDVKGDRRELKMGKHTRPLLLEVTKLDNGLYRIEASEVLEDGEYVLSPNGSDQVFCFQEY